MAAGGSHAPSGALSAWRRRASVAAAPLARRSGHCHRRAELREGAAAAGAEARLEVEHVDTTDPEQVRALRQRLEGRTFGLLLVNAGVTHDQALTIANISTAELTRVVVTNALAPVRLLEVLDDVVAEDGTVAVRSSGQGSVSTNDGGGWEVYRASRAALDQLVRSDAARHRDGARAVLLPARWVPTEMGGSAAGSSVEEAVSEPALEGLTESLSQEVAVQGISVTLVEPGGSSTDWSGASAHHSEEMAEYQPVRDATRERYFTATPGDPAAAAQALLRVVDADEPPLRVLFGSGPTTLVPQIYAKRLATWKQWEDVSHLAQGS